MVVLTSVCARPVRGGVRGDVVELKSIVGTKTLRFVLNEERRRLKLKLIECS